MIEDLFFFLIPLFLFLIGIWGIRNGAVYFKTGDYQGIVTKWTDEEAKRAKSNYFFGGGVVATGIGIIIIFILLAIEIKSYFNFANPIPLLLSGAITSLIPLAIIWYFYRYWKKDDAVKS